ncbi:Transposon Tf2-9 polyprotein [Labeo rohita]|uniref:Gypsy retrotransposon integrase-like protein 1 n=1 Tax=Labeo rohita TaxID=84645 RepID=A0ABQ8L3E1_LABRO|nr:Transposon Tf2-9 polyprotein [Labeo rohita]
MPYGLADSPSIFQNFMNEIFRDFLHQFVIVYIDDILIYSHDLQEHRRHVLQVLQRLREHHLYLKLEKREFHQSFVSFLGYVISGDGVRMEQNKVQEAFQRLKQAFTTASVLQHPDPNKPFVVEVDAADTGVGAVLSQWSGEPLALHPCAYYSKKLTPAEQNYGIGDRELLAIKQALEEWRHWLEGAKHPFQVITDHKNLQYLRNAKRLNARQARWSMFFTRFRFHITYQPKHKNLKADALSRLHSTDPVDESPEPILPPSVFLAPIIWQLDDQTSHATLAEAAPPGGPAGRTYVPTHLRLPLLDSAHTSLGSGHPGSRQTLMLLRQRYWWPNMAKEVARYVKGCSVCAVTTTPRRLPEGKLKPHPIPRRPWTHIGVDFATHLPPSNGKKLSPRYIGPFTIHSQINAVTYRLNLPPQYRISLSFHVSLLKPYAVPVLPSPAEPEPLPPPLQPEVIGDQIYRIQEILHSRCRGNRLQYLIDWEGYRPEERSWVDREDILDPTLLAEFHQRHPELPAPRGRGRPRKRSGVPGGTREGGASVTSSSRSQSRNTREPSPDY